MTGGCPKEGPQMTGLTDCVCISILGMPKFAALCTEDPKALRGCSLSDTPTNVSTAQHGNCSGNYWWRNSEASHQIEVRIILIRCSLNKSLCANCCLTYMHNTRNADGRSHVFCMCYLVHNSKILKHLVQSKKCKRHNLQPMMLLIITLLLCT